MKALITVIFLFVNYSFAQEADVISAQHGDEIILTDNNTLHFVQNKKSCRAKVRVHYDLNLKRGEEYCEAGEMKSVDVSGEFCEESSLDNGRVQYPFEWDNSGKCKKYFSFCKKINVVAEDKIVGMTKKLKVKYSRAAKRSFSGSQKFKVVLNKDTACFELYPLSNNTQKFRIANHCTTIKISL